MVDSELVCRAVTDCAIVIFETKGASRLHSLDEIGMLDNLKEAKHFPCANAGWPRSTLISFPDRLLNRQPIQVHALSPRKMVSFLNISIFYIPDLFLRQLFCRLGIDCSSSSHEQISMFTIFYKHTQGCLHPFSHIRNFLIPSEILSFS
jgi:hypothetical protein